ncbi:MAG: biopolymer transporter ExbD [Thermodesulfobacteriota bacterium]
MARRPTRRLHKNPVWTDLNLIPVMNLFMVLIPFLLLSAVFARTAIIDVYLPRDVPESAETAAVPGDVLTVHITEKGFAFSGLGEGTPPVGKKDGFFDFGLLTANLLEIKGQYPDREEVILLFEPSTPYELVVKTMDATRERITSENGRVIRDPLFPLVSVGEHTERDKG